MNAAILPDDDDSDVVTLDFQIKFHKTDSVLAPDGSLHAVNAKCLKQNYRKILKLEPFEHDGDTKLIDEERVAYLKTSSNHRALLGVAVALFDAQFARTLSDPLRPRIPPAPDAGS